MTAHRWIADDGGRSCYACGIVDMSSDGAAAVLPCRPGGWQHPPVVLGTNHLGEPYLETCAAHPYECRTDPTREAEWRGRFLPR